MKHLEYDFESTWMKMEENLLCLRNYRWRKFITTLCILYNIEEILTSCCCYYYGGHRI